MLHANGWPYLVFGQVSEVVLQHIRQEAGWEGAQLVLLDSLTLSD